MEERRSLAIATVCKSGYGSLEPVSCIFDGWQREYPITGWLLSRSQLVPYNADVSVTS